MRDQLSDSERWLMFPWEAEGPWKVEVMRVDSVPDGPVSREVVWVKHVHPEPGWTTDPFPVDHEWLRDAA